MREQERAHELALAQIKKEQLSAENPNSFDIIKYIKLVPKFSEEEVGKFFVSFEKVANQLKWPKEQWAIMLQVVLTGKAQVAYSALSAEDSSDYEIVKKVVLRAYELVPEAYRQKFRNLRKGDSQSHMEFAREKERLFEDWYKSRNVEDFNSLKELVLLEEYKNCISKEIKTHLEEMQIENLETAAKLSDEYSLTHKHSSSFEYNYRSPPQTRRKNGSNQKDRVGSPNGYNKKEITCYHCGKKGHIKANCFEFWRASQGQVKGSMLVKTIKNKRDVGVSESTCQRRSNCKSGNLACSESKVRGPDVCEDDLEDFRWFISSGSVVFPNSSKKVDVRILRDTGESQSLILESVLPKSMKVGRKRSVLVGGFPNSIVSSPLVTVVLDSSLVKGPVKVAVVKTLPVKGIDFVLGNDLAQDKVFC